MRLKLRNWRVAPRVGVREDTPLPGGRRRAVVTVSGMLCSL